MSRRHLTGPTDTVLFRESCDAPIVRIPASELAPGLVRAAVVREDGTREPAAYMPADATRPEPGNYWPAVPPVARGVADAIYEQVREFSGCATADEWADGFRNDAHPWAELHYWWAFAGVYRSALAAFRPAGTLVRRRLYNAVLLCSEGTPQAAVARCPGLSRHRAEALFNLWQKARADEHGFRIAAACYLDFVPDRSVPMRMTDAELIAFINARS